MGHVFKDNDACLQISGLMKCSIVPPKRLNHQVLPFRSKKKLLFFMCPRAEHLQRKPTHCWCWKGPDWNVGYRRGSIGTGIGLQITRNLLSVRLSSHPLQPGNKWRCYFRGLYKNIFQTKRVYPSWVRSTEKENRRLLLFPQSEGIRLNR